MRALLSKPGFAAAAVGAVLLLHLVIAPLLLSADREFVYFRGQPLPEACSLRAFYGVPCPTCGMTRGSVLALHGRLADSWEVNRAAPVFVGALLVIGAGLLGVGLLRLTRRDRAGDAVARWTQSLGLASAALWAVVLAVNWILTLRLLKQG